MRLVSVNQLLLGTTTMLLSGAVGAWLDRRDRRAGALIVLAANNLCVTASAALIVVSLWLADDANEVQRHLHWTLVYALCLIGAVAFCAAARCAYEGQKMAFSKDWVVVMVQARDEQESLSSQSAVNVIPPSTRKLANFNNKALSKNKIFCLFTSFYRERALEYRMRIT